MTIDAEPIAEAAALDLRSLVQRFRLRFQVAPERATVGDELRTIGWNVELSASHEPSAHEPTPGCPACAPVEQALAAVVAAVLPRGPQDSSYDFHVFPSKHSFSGGHVAPEMTAQISILHKTNISAPADAAESRCLKQVVESLRALGAREGGTS